MYTIAINILVIAASIAYRCIKTVVIWMARLLLDVLRTFFLSRVGIIALIPYAVTCIHILNTHDVVAENVYSAHMYIFILLFVLIASVKAPLEGLLIGFLIYSTLQGTGVEVSNAIDLGITGKVFFDTKLPFYAAVILIVCVLRHFKVTYWVISILMCILYAGVIVRMTMEAFDLFWNIFHVLSIFILTFAGHWIVYNLILGKRAMKKNGNAIEVNAFDA